MSRFKIIKIGLFCISLCLPLSGKAASVIPYMAPWAMVFDATGNLYMADAMRHQILRMAAETHTVSIIAGIGKSGFTGDGGPARQAALNFPTHLAIDRSGDLYVVDSGNHRIRRIDTKTMVISTIARTGKTMGSGGPANQARFIGPGNRMSDVENALSIENSVGYDEDRNYIRYTDNKGLIHWLARDVKACYRGLDVQVETYFCLTEYIVRDNTENLYLGNFNNNPIKKIDTKTKTVTTLTPILATALALDYHGNLYVLNSNQIHRVDSNTGNLSLIAGSGKEGYSGDGGSALQATFNRPANLLFDDQDNLYIADSGNLAVRKINAKSGMIETILKLK